MIMRQLLTFIRGV